MEKPPLVWGRSLLEWRCFVRNVIVVVAHVRNAATRLAVLLGRVAEIRAQFRSIAFAAIWVRRAAMLSQFAPRCRLALHPHRQGCHAFADQTRRGDSAAGWRAGAGWRCRRYPINERIASSCRCAACLPWIYRARSLDASRSTCLTVTGFAGAMTSAWPWRSYSQMCSRCSL